MGKRGRKERDAKAPRVRVEELLAKGDARGAVEAAKLLVREEPGPASELLAVRAYAERIKGLIAEGLGKEAAGIAAILRERFPAHLAPWTSLLEDARLAAGDFDWILLQLHAAPGEMRTALEERLLPWITDPAALARSSALHPADPLVSEARTVAGLFEIVTSRLASTDELAGLGDIRRRSPLAPWKLFLRALDAFHRQEDERARPNIAAIDLRSPAARAGAVLADLIEGRQKPERSSVEARLIDLVSGGRAAIAAHVRNIEKAAMTDDRRTLRDELRALVRSFDKLSPYALEQARIALLAMCGLQFAPEQIAALFHIPQYTPPMPRYAAMVMELGGAPVAYDIWVAYADELSAAGKLQPWQAAEIYLHALSLADRDDDDDFFDDPFDHVFGDPFADPSDDPFEQADPAEVIEKIIAARPAPAALARLTPFLDRLEGRELRRVLTAWRRADPGSPLPLIRLLGLAEKEAKYDDEMVSWIRQGDRLKILDPEYARLRLHLLFRRAERLLGTRKRDAAAALLKEIASRPDDLPGDTGTYLLALQ
jgi:hypothetical protein